MQPTLGPGIRRLPSPFADAAEPADYSDLFDQAPLDRDRVDAYFATLG